MDCLNTFQLPNRATRSHGASALRVAPGPIDQPIERFVPSNGNFQDMVNDRALRNFAVKFGGPRGSNSDTVPSADARVEELGGLARADDVRPMTAKEEKIFREALALIDRAGRRSKTEAKYYASIKPGFEALLKEQGKVVVAPTMRDEFQTIGDRTRLSQNLLDLDDGTKRGHDSAVVVTAILLAHEWAHNKRGGAQTTHIPDKEGKINPHLSGLEMGRLIKEMYAADLKNSPPGQHAGIRQKIDIADHWIEAHIEGGLGEGYQMDYDSRDIRHHVKRKRR